jgi:hypothetical protein
VYKFLSARLAGPANANFDLKLEKLGAVSK